nr:NADH dehydrogenase subunit 2 [Pyrrhidium sanguineum]
MFKFYKILFLNTLMIGTLLSISSYSWFSMWIGLEINLLSIIPLMKSPGNFFPSEAALKYFITQALASSILMFSIIMIMNMNEFIPQNSNYFMMMVMNSALFTKVGAAPFHMWFPEVMEGLNWNNCLILLTWQKLAPMVLIMYNTNMITFFSLIIIFSSITGSVLGLNQISLRKILAYSSINHIGWMLASMLSSKTIWFIYFLVYSIINLNIILILKQWNVLYLTQLINMLNSNKINKFLFMMNFLSLGGIPPFLGFFPKWLTLNFLAQNQFFSLSLILILTALITLFFYLRLTFSSMILNMKETIFLKPTDKSSFLSYFTNFLSLTGLGLCASLFSFA